MSSSSLNRYLLVSLLAVSGCNPDTAPPTVDSLNDVMQSAVVKGKYKESNGNAVLTIASQAAIFSTDQGSMTKPYSVSNGKVIFQMSSEDALRTVRPNLEMIIEQKGDVLVCTACAGMGLDSYWYRIDD